MAKYRDAVFILTCAKTKKGWEYLILKRKLHWKGWEFPKGGVEKKENLLDAVKRELKEETGLDSLFIKDMNFSGKYKYEKEFEDREGIIGQTYKLFLVRVEKGNPKLDKREHSSFQWTSYNGAKNMLTWENQKKSLKLVNGYLKNMKFREIKLDSGNIVLMGKDRKNNETLVKEFMGKENVIMHTVASGSPFCVALEKPSAKDKKQIASLCAAYSQDWRDNKENTKIHVFTGKDVNKNKLMKTGTFGVRKAKVIIAKKEDIKKWEKK